MTPADSSSLLINWSVAIKDFSDSIKITPIPWVPFAVFNNIGNLPPIWSTRTSRVFSDFTNAVLSRIQQKELCAKANGTNSATGESTEYSLGC